MPNTIEQYRQAKQDILKLHSVAKKELVARFNELANELLLIQQELREEFGVKLPIPTKPRPSRAKSTPVKSKAPEPKKPDQKSAAVSSEINALEKRLALHKRKLEEAVKAGKPEKAIQDRIYEVEDELRLAREK
ncbi:MAG TPA: hypothetical protein VHZ55_04695 [Bryobacteraceae bacterium]|jgi:hypothetical protein|nr:hypothetical protein [Bryobacteraceae bacterium]